MKFKIIFLFYFACVYSLLSYLDNKYKLVDLVEPQFSEDLVFHGEKETALQKTLHITQVLLKIPNLIGQYLFKKLDYYTNSEILTLDKLKSQYKNSCLKINDPTWDINNLDEAQKLQAFNDGPCSPMILVPGIMATALMVEINCKELQQYEPEIFKSCGWNTCEDTSIFNIFDSKPENEYRIWAGSLFDPVSILGKDKCFGNLIQTRYNYNAKTMQEKFQSPRGLKVSWRGDTKETKDNYSCGSDAVVNIAENPINYLTKKFLGFRDLVELLQTMGYQPGLSYQAIPYDFRKAMVYSNIDRRIRRSLDSLKKMTGKRVTILSHSYGSLRTLFALNHLPQEYKDTHINQWIANGSPFSGVNRLIKTHLNADDQFVSKIGEFFGKELFAGIQFQHQRLNAPGATALFDLYPRDHMTKHRDTPWMDEILERINYESKSTQKGIQYKDDEIPLNFLPPTHELCTHELYDEDETLEGQCKTDLYDAHHLHLAKIEETPYKIEDVKVMFKDYSSLEDVVHIMEETKQPVLDELINPGVPMVNVYGAFGEVEVQYHYDEDPQDFTEKEQFYFPKVTQANKGDLTVSTNSALVGPLKWIWEHNNRNNYNITNQVLSEEQQKIRKNPVRLVELCSSYGLSKDVNQVQNDSGENLFTESGYNGLQCRCMFTKNPEDCDHTLFLNDPYVIQFFANQLNSNQTSSLEPNSIVNQYKSEELRQMVKECPNLH